MRTADRRRLILERVRGDGHADAVTLSRDFRVDGSTIRRDLARLERAGLIRRTRGGALPNDPSEVVDIPYEMRRVEREAAKHAIGRAAAELVKNGDTVILDTGSTTHEVALALRHHRNLTIITNDLLIGVIVARQPANRLLMTGGFVLTSHYTLTGPQAVAAFAGLHADWLFIGAEGIHPETGITNINVVEIPTKQAMIAAAKAVVFVADSSKFGRRAFAELCKLSEASVLLTDDDLPPQDRGAYGSRLHCVPVI